MNALHLILLVAAFATVLPAAWLGLLTLAALCRRTRSSVQEQSARIAIVIPAHNEELSIAKTLRAIHESEYPAERCQAFVIADNCQDQTAAIARSMQAIAAERSSETEKGKGYALDWFLKTYREDLADFDLIVIIDADTQVDTRFLAESSAAFQREAKLQAAQGYYGVANLEAGWRARLAEAAFAVSHHLRALGRNALGSTAGLKGNGMIFRAALLLRTGWPAHGLVEDLEFSVQLLEREGITVRYLPDARVRAEMANRNDAAASQRMRWEGGRMQVVKELAPRLGLRFLRTGHWPLLESLIELLIPPMAIHVVGLAVTALAAFFLRDNLVLILAGAGLLTLVLHVLIALLARRVPGSVWLSLLNVPFFILWKAPIYLKLALKGPAAKWERTRRDQETSHPLLDCLAEKGPIEKKLAQTGKWQRRSEKRITAWNHTVRFAEALKRALDIAGSLVLLTVLSPVMLLTALLIKLEDGGPVFFRQTRVGRMGKHFSIFKFRSMVVNAEAARDTLEEQNGHERGVTFKIKRDPRITRVGGVIRKLSIDEMPQFFNVLAGSMSLVGPRPPLPSEVKYYNGLHLRRLHVKPGITCLWQIRGRADIDFDGQVQLDLEYIHSESLWNDVLILLKTIPAVLFARGAY